MSQRPLLDITQGRVIEIASDDTTIQVDGSAQSSVMSMEVRRCVLASFQYMTVSGLFARDLAGDASGDPEAFRHLANEYVRSLIEKVAEEIERLQR